jgi:DNA end-binding protein Ku
MKTTKLAFGPLVKVSVKMYKATDDGDAGEMDFHQHHGPDCLGRIRYARRCEDCGQDVEYVDIVRATEFEDKLVVVSDDEMDQLSEEIGPNIEIQEFVGNDEWDPLLLTGSSYYLASDGDDDAYGLLRELLVEDEKVAIVRFVMRTSITMGVVRPMGNLLVLHRMLWFDQVRSAHGLPGVDKVVQPSAQEMEFGRRLVADLTRDFDPSKFSDGKTARLREYVAAKAAGQKPHFDKPVELDDQPSGLLAQLQASVKTTKKPPVKKAPAKKRSA